jgi:rhodanese-related sulfurtransferase
MLGGLHMEKQNYNQLPNQASSDTVVNSYTATNTTANTTQQTANTTQQALVGSQPQRQNPKENPKQNQTIIGVFESRGRAENAVNTLRQQGFTSEEINIVSKKQQNTNTTQGETYDDDIVDGTLTGGTLGGIGGLLMGAGALLLPGIGPILAVGPITAAVGGAIAGGIAGGLIDWGIPAEASQRYEQEVAQGSILAIIRTDTTKVTSAAQILRQNGAKDVENHSK